MPTWCTIFLNMFISFLYVFQETMYPSSGEITVFMRHLVLVIPYGWLYGMQEHMLLHTSHIIQNNKYQVSHKYSCFSWWLAHSRPKHVGKRNIRTTKSCAPSWLYLQDYARMLGQQNIKLEYFVISFRHIDRARNTIQVLWKFYLFTNWCTSELS
jgi:hypothetical protein